MVALRDAVKVDETHLLQKVIPDADAHAYRENQTKHGSDSIAGFIARASDTVQLRSTHDLFEGLRLDYTLDDGSMQFAPDRPMSVIRFTAEQLDPEVPRSTSFGGSAGYDTTSPPFTGNGFTGSSREVVPEFRVGGTRMDDGAEMWEVVPDGSQRLTAVLEDGTWVKVEP